MSPEKISHPEELLSIPAEALFSRLKQLLRRGGLLQSDQLMARVKQNLPSVCWEIGQRWKENPCLGKREAPFSEVLAATLCNELLAQDRRENPHLYDSHRKYLAERETLQLLDDDSLAEKYFPLPPRKPTAHPTSQGANWRHQMAAAAANGRIHEASTNALLQHMTEIEGGEIKTAYKFARAQGRSPTEARYQPATGPYIAITNYLSGHAATTIATSSS